MPIYRCNACGYVSEDATVSIGQKQPCGRCGKGSTVYGTVFFVEKLVERYMTAMRELHALRAAEDETPESATEINAPETVDPSNTDYFATAEQHAPLQQWFAARDIEAEFDYSLVDTRGFFDDAARLLGDGIELFSELIDRVAYAYRKGHGWINLELGRLAQKDAAAVNKLCRQLYGHALFGRYHYQKPEKIVRLTLQTAPAARRFFEGGWLEWYVFLQALEKLGSKDTNGLACARGVKIRFSNDDVHELDVVFLPSGQSPICIECKSGEFRRDIDKYVRLRKRLGLARERFIVCASDLSGEQATGLSAMYELAFVNLSSLPSHLSAIR